MPTLTRWFIKIALLYFIAALLLAILLAAAGMLELPAWIGSLGPAYFHLFMVGWVTQLIAGVVFWMFPKFTSDRPRGSEALAWATFWLLNIGLLLRVVAEPIQTTAPDSIWGWALILSAILQWIGGLAFVVNTWGRVK